MTEMAGLEKIFAVAAASAITQLARPMIVKVGPHGFIHGWIYVGPAGELGHEFEHPKHGHGKVISHGHNHVVVQHAHGTEKYAATFAKQKPKMVKTGSEKGKTHIANVKVNKWGEVHNKDDGKKIGSVENDGLHHGWSYEHDASGVEGTGYNSKHQAIKALVEKHNEHADQVGPPTPAPSPIPSVQTTTATGIPTVSTNGDVTIDGKHVGKITTSPGGNHIATAADGTSLGIHNSHYNAVGAIVDYHKNDNLAPDTATSTPHPSMTPAPAPQKSGFEMGDTVSSPHGQGKITDSFKASGEQYHEVKHDDGSISNWPEYQLSKPTGASPPVAPAPKITTSDLTVTKSPEGELWNVATNGQHLGTITADPHSANFDVYDHADELIGTVGSPVKAKQLLVDHVNQQGMPSGASMPNTPSVTTPASSTSVSVPGSKAFATQMTYQDGASGQKDLMVHGQKLGHTEKKSTGGYDVYAVHGAKGDKIGEANSGIQAKTVLANHVNEHGGLEAHGVIPPPGSEKLPAPPEPKFKKVNVTPDDLHIDLNEFGKTKTVKHEGNEVGAVTTDLEAGKYTPVTKTGDSLGEFNSMDEAKKALADHFTKNGVPVQTAADFEASHLTGTAAWNHLQRNELKGAPKSAVLAYTGSAYSDINNYLRTGKQNPKKNTLFEADAEAKVVKQVQNIDKAFEAAHPTKQKIMVYRGMRNTVDKFGPVGSAEGKVFRDDGFGSSSTQMSVASNFAKSHGSNPTIVKVSVPKGSKVLKTEGITHYSHEAEVLLPRGMRYRVISDQMVNGMREMHVEMMPRV